MPPPPRPTDPPGWLSSHPPAAFHVPSTAAAAVGPGARMADRRAYHEARQTTLPAAFFSLRPDGGGGREEEGAGRGRGKGRVPGQREGTKRKARASEPAISARRGSTTADEVPPARADGPSRRDEGEDDGDASPPQRAKRPRRSAPLPAASSRTGPAPRISPSGDERGQDGQDARTRATCPPAAAAAAARPARPPRAVKPEPASQPGLALAGPGPSSLAAAARLQEEEEEWDQRQVKLELESQLPGGKMLSHTLPPEEEDDNDAHDDSSLNIATSSSFCSPPASYHAPNPHLSASLAPYLPASYPSPPRLIPSQILAELLTLGRPFAGPGGRERYLRRPRMAWETEEAWGARIDELAALERERAEERLRRRRPLEPPARGALGAQAQQEADQRAADESSDEDEPAFLRPRKLNWPRPEMGPVRVPPPPRSPPPRGGRRQRVTTGGDHAPSPPPADPSQLQELHARAELHLPPPPRPAAPPGDGGDQQDAESVSQTQDSAYFRWVDARLADELARAASQASLARAPAPQEGPVAAPRGLTEEEETSVLLDLPHADSPPPPSLPLRSPSGAHAHEEVVPSSQTDDASFTLSLRTAPVHPRGGTEPEGGRILVLATQESRSSTPRDGRAPVGLSQASSAAAGEEEDGVVPPSPAHDVIALLPLSSSRAGRSSASAAPSLAALDTRAAPGAPRAFSTPTRRRLLAGTGTRGGEGEGDVVPSSEASERVALLPLARAGPSSAEGRSASPTPVKRVESLRRLLASASKLVDKDKGKARAKPRVSWPTWAGAAVTTAAEDDADDLGLLGPADGVAPLTGATQRAVPPSATTLVQDSLIQHGFGRTVTRALRRPSPDLPPAADEQLTDSSTDDDGAGPGGESIVPSSQSLAPLGWGRRAAAGVGGGWGRVPSPPPREVVLARPVRRAVARAPAAASAGPVPVSAGERKVVVRDDEGEGEGDDGPVPNSQARSSPVRATPSPSKPLLPTRASSPSTSEDDEDAVDADCTLVPGPLPPLAPVPAAHLAPPVPAQGEQLVVPDSQPQAYPPLGAAGEDFFDWLASSGSSSEVDLGVLG